MKKIIMLGMFVFMISACSSSSDSTIPGGTGGGVLDTPVSGKVVHSAFSASDKVCYDRNGNKQCDAGEPFALVSSDGTYTIMGTVADSAAVPLIAELGGASVPASLYDVSALLALGAPALVFETPAGQRTISSITTIIKSAMDSNPSLSLGDAEDKVKASLNVNTSLFDSSSDILALANKISAAIESMFNKLAADFNITISKNAILLVMNEILPQLSSIADGTKTPEQVANDTIGNKNQNTITQEMEELADNVPSVKTAQDAFKNGLQMYDFRHEDSSYLFQLYDFSNSAMRMFIDGNYQSALPTTLSQNTNNMSAFLNNDGSVAFTGGVYNENINALTVETIQLGGKSLASNPRHGTKTINFPAGAILYKLNTIHAAPIIDADAIRANNCSNTGFACGPAAVNNNTIEIRWQSSGNYDIVMKNDGTYSIKNDEASKYYESMVFSPALTPPSGKYTKSTDSYGDVYSFKNVDGVVVFKVFKSNYSYQVAGKLNESLSATTLMFNKTAAESIQSQW